MNKLFWRATAVRALRTVCQAAIALIPASALITEVDWLLVASASILAGIVSVLTSIATGLPEVDMVEEVEEEEEEDDD